MWLRHCLAVRERKTTLTKGQETQGRRVGDLVEGRGEQGAGAELRAGSWNGCRARIGCERQAAAGQGKQAAGEPECCRGIAHLLALDDLVLCSQKNTAGAVTVNGAPRGRRSGEHAAQNPSAHRRVRPWGSLTRAGRGAVVEAAHGNGGGVLEELGAGGTGEKVGS